MTPLLELRTLGRLELVRGGETILPGRRKLLMLLAYLALREGRTTSRAVLAQLFWPEADESRARQSLRQALSELRETVGSALQAGDEDVQLATGAVVVDAQQFQVANDRGALSAAEALWQGDFLEGADLRAGEEFRGWLEPVRTRLRDRRARLGESLVQQAVDRGTWDVALQHAERWAAALPLDEDAGRRVAELRTLASRRRSTPGGIALLTPDLVGRADVFKTLTSAWNRVTAGEARVLLIEGESGTGKTRLVHDFLRSVRQQRPGSTTLEVRAWESEREQPLVLARHLLAPLASAPGASAAPPSALHALAAVAPEFSERFSGVPAAPPDRLPEAAARVLSEVATESPVLMLIDDLQFADSASRELIEALCRRPVQGVLLVLTTTPDGIKLTEGTLTRARLGPLDREQLERLVAGMAEFRPDDRARLVRRLQEETGGNPLMAVELMNGLADAGHIAPAPDGTWIAELPPDDAPLPLPRSLRDQIANRIAPLSQAARDLLERCAVLGRDATVPRLRAESGHSDLAFDTALDELVRTRLLRAPTGSDHLEFSHSAARQLVSEGLTPARRQALVQGSSRRRRWVIVGAAVAATILLGIWITRSQPIPATGPITVRVAPVTALGDSVSEDLALAAHDALVSALARGSGITVLDSMATRQAMLEVGVSVELTATGMRLSGQARRTGREQALAEARADGGPEELPATAAALADRLFPARIGSAPFALTSARTRSAPALRKYFAGLRLSATGQMEGAAQQHWLATRDDTNFVAAWHQLARINAWFTLSDRSRRMSALAVQRASGLTRHDLMLLQGWQQFSDGRAEEAEAIFRQVLGFAHDNQEATVGLAEVLYHHAWRRGRDPAISGSVWDVAAAADPHDWRPRSHRWEVAARQGRFAEAAQLLRESLEADGGGTSRTALLLAQFDRDTGDILNRIAALPDDNEWALHHLAYLEAILVGRIDRARACLERLTGPGHSAEVQAGSLNELALLSLAEGRMRDAQALVERARRLEPVSAAMTEAILWAAPFLPTALADTGRPAARARLARVNLRPIRRTRLFWLDYDNQRAALERWYLLALLSPDGKTVGPPVLPGPMADSVARLTTLLQNSLAARAALAHGERAEAAALLANGWDGVEAGEGEMSILNARPWDHFQRALLLEADGRLEEAVQWFAAIGTLSIATVPYRAPAAWHQARLLEQLGRPAEAVTAYRTVIDLWRRADPEFQPTVEEARARVKALGGGPG